MPDSHRTYQAGTRVDYPGEPYVRAHFPFKTHLGIYVVMTVQRGPAPDVVPMGQGLGVRIGDWEWGRPFGAAVPAAFIPGESGVLCRYPDGDR